jgi:hypothetical protein
MKIGYGVQHHNVAKPHPPLSFIQNKRGVMFHGDLAATLRLRIWDLGFTVELHITLMFL